MSTWVSYDLFKEKISKKEVVCAYMPNLDTKLVCCNKINKKDKDFDKNYKKRRCSQHQNRKGVIKDCIKNDPPILDKKPKNECNYIQGLMLGPPKNELNVPTPTNTTTNSTINPTRRIIRTQNVTINRPQIQTTTWYSRLMNVLDTVTGDTIFTQLNQQGTRINTNNYYDIPLTALPASFLEPVQIQRNITISNNEPENETPKTENKNETPKTENKNETSKTENKNETDRTCIVCMTDEPIYVCVPCGHMILCESCVKAGSHNQLQGKCPTCRANIDTLTKVFK
jgi:hypothetical protein